MLHRKLPAVAHLSLNSAINVKAAGQPSNTQVAQTLANSLQTDLLKNGQGLRSDAANPDITISCNIVTFETPPRQPFTKTEYVYQNGKNVQLQVPYYRITGVLEVNFQASDRAGKNVDSDSVSGKYSRDFAQATNKPAQQQGLTSMFHSLKDSLKKPGQAPPVEMPPTATELRDDLVHQVVSQIAAHLVNTDEPVEVLLARGSFDEANKLTDSNLWSRYAETLETMKPLSNPSDDAYRLYNIGVAYEAMAYQAEDRAAARKFLEQAAINYGKAIDENSSEKYFLEPQRRIDTAIAYYKKLQDREETELAAARARTPLKDSKTAGGGVTNAALREKDSNVLTNEKVVEMVRSGVDEETILETIHQSPAVKFDLSADGMIELAKNGVKGKIPAAMRERSRPKPQAAKAAHPKP